MKKKVLRKILYKLSRKVIKYFVTFLLIFSVFLGTTFSCYHKTEAAPAVALTVGAAVSMISSLVGLVNIGTDGGVSAIGGDVRDRIANWWVEQTGNGGITTDHDGNYVFSGAATNALYESLDANTATDAKVVSNFPFNIEKHYSASFVTPLNSWVSNNNYSKGNILKVYTYGIQGDLSDPYYYNKMCYFNFSDVAYIICEHSGTKGTFVFKNSSGQTINVPCACVTQIVHAGDFSNTYSRGFNANSFNFDSSYSYAYNNSNNNTNFCFSNSSYVSSLDSVFVYFPFNCCACPKSLILAKNVSAADRVVNGGEGLYITNNFVGGTLPSISSEVVNNNNWDTVYNNFVQNIVNDQDSYIKSDGTVDWQALRDAIGRACNDIMDAIEQGNTDIADRIDYTNEWLKKIHSLLKQIKQIVLDNQGQSGGGSVDLSEIEGSLSSIDSSCRNLSELSDISSELQDVLLSLADIEDYISSVDSKLNSLSTLQSQYTILSNIYTYMIQHPWGSGSTTNGPFIKPTDDPWKDWFDYLDSDDFPNEAILSKFNVITTLLQSIAPFCFVVFIGQSLSSLVAEPVEPIFTIPIRSNNQFFSFNEDIEVDLTFLAPLLPFIRSMIIILFTIGLMLFSFSFLRNLLQIFDL